MKIKEIVVVSGNRSTKKRNAVATYGYPMNLPGIKSTEVGDVVFFHENAEVGVEYQRQEENG